MFLGVHWQLALAQSREMDWVERFHTVNSMISQPENAA